MYLNISNNKNQNKMKKGMIIGGVAAGLLVVFAIIYFSMKWSYENKNVRLKNQIVAQQESNKANFDKMFKVIQQIADVADEYKEAFKEIYPQLIEGRYNNSKDGALMKWVTESNPNFDISLYSKLANAIEANRQEFFIEQQKLIDYNREQHNLINTVPGSWFLESNDTIAIKIITSAVTKETFATGEENEIDIFGRDTINK